MSYLFLSCTEQKFIEIGYEIQKALQIELGDDYEVFYQP